MALGEVPPLDDLLPISLAEAPNNEQVGVYRIEALLGRGGMGEVFLAWDEILQRHVAIKKVLAVGPPDSVQRQRFLREARAVARLDHPAIVRIYHVLDRGDGDWLVMEYVKGQDLAKLAAGGRVDVVQATLLARGIAEGLAEAHSHGLVHRDLKLANVMVTLNGGVKILDFGLAKAREGLPERGFSGDPEKAELDLTGAGVIAGTAFAMSPEQAAGDPLDPRSDLFSLGGLLYELLSGIRPFQGATLAETLRNVLLHEPLPIWHLVPELPTELCTMVAALLAKNRENRPASAQAVVDGLTRVLDLLGVSPAASPTFRAPAAGWPANEADLDGSTAEQPIAFLKATPRPSQTVDLRTVASLRVSAEGVPGSQAELRRCAEAIASRFDCQGVEGSGIHFLFRRPAEAVAFALAVHGEISTSPPIEAAIALHLGEITLPGAFGRVRAGDHADLFAKADLLARHARGSQTLLSRTVFDLARGARAPAELLDPGVRWLAHGSYFAAGDDETTEIFEVGREGFAPLCSPADSAELRRALHLSQDVALGWRPAIGQEVPRRPEWQLVERLGEGGFGEVWLARHAEGEERVFKFCFDPQRLRALKREVTIFRLLRETLGHRQDIARLISWDFEEVPFFLESAFTDGGDLPRWAAHRGGLLAIPLATRLELVAQAAEALAAAHSVGVLHKDVKPQNVLVGHDADGRPRAVLTEFGLSLLTRREALEKPGFTVLGFSESVPDLDDTKAGTARYMAPELLAGQPATIAADVYSLGVLLYQLVVGQFDRSPVEGWRREIEDDLVAADIAACVDGSAERRLRSPAELAERLRSLAERRRQHEQEEAEAAANLRNQRRRRIASWLGTAAAVLLPLLSLFAYQTYQAKKQAEQRREQAESLIDFMLGDLREQLQPIGKLKILDQVGDRALDYFAKVPKGDLSPAEMASNAKAMHQIGQVRFGLGKMPEAAEAFSASLEMAKRLAASDPANSQRQFELGQSHFWVGFLRWKERKLDLALAEFESYLQISKALVAQDPQNQEWQVELAYSHSNIGSIREEQDDVDGAALSLQESLRVFDRLIERQPGSTQLVMDAAGVEQKLGEVLHRQWDLPGALSQHRASLRHYEAALEQDRDNAELLFFVGTAKGYVGNLLLAMGDTVGALELFHADMNTMQRLVDRDPENFTYKELLSQRINKVGRAFLGMGRREQARREFERDQSLVLELIKKNASIPAWRFAQARNLCNSALYLLENGEPGKAIALAEECRSNLADLNVVTQDRTYRLLFSRACLILALSNQELGKNQKAALFAEEGAEVAASLVENHPFPTEIDLYVRLMVSSERRSVAASWIHQLTTMGYRESIFQGFLNNQKSGWPGSRQI